MVGELGKRQTGTALNDIIVIGGSAGSIAAMMLIVGAFPIDFPAAVFIVTHLARRSPSVLDRILERAGVLPCKVARDNEEIRPGRIYVAAPDRHLIVQGPFVRLLYGPRHNLSRPAIDMLFRSAAQSYGPSVTGVVLSGMLDDGAQGLVTIKEYGGTTIVQDPEDALHSDMPENALRYADVDYVLPAAEIGAQLVEHVKQHMMTVQKAGVISRREDEGVAWAQEGAFGMKEAVNVVDPDGEVFVLSCPECGGPLTEMKDKQLLTYRCVVGHSYSLETLYDLQHDGIERALWTALRSMHELIALRRRMIERMEAGNGNPERKAELEYEIREAERDATVLSQLLYTGNAQETPV